MTAAPAIRRGAPDDAPALAALMRAFEDFLDAFDPALANNKPDADLRAAADRLLTDPAFTVLIVEAGGAPAGYLAFSPIMWMDDAAPALWISDLFVAERARGLGLGRALMAAAEREAAARGARRLVWTVWDRNRPAIDFYAAEGGAPVAGEILMSRPVR